MNIRKNKERVRVKAIPRKEIVKQSLCMLFVLFLFGIAITLFTNSASAKEAEAPKTNLQKLIEHEYLEADYKICSQGQQDLDECMAEAFDKLGQKEKDEIES